MKLLNFLRFSGTATLFLFVVFVFLSPKTSVSDHPTQTGSETVMKAEAVSNTGENLVEAAEDTEDKPTKPEGGEDTQVTAGPDSNNPDRVDADEKDSPASSEKKPRKWNKKRKEPSLSVEERLALTPVVPEAESMVLEALVPTKMLANRNVLKSMMRIPRALFVPKDLRSFAYQDITLPIGASQTISPPFVVAYMTEQLDPQPTDRVLEIGTGSGYQAAVLSPLVDEVFTIEIIPSLGKRATETLKDLGFENVNVKIGDGYLGWPEAAPFDKIIVTCSPEDVPQPLVDQLAEGGKILIPIGERYDQQFFLLTKTGDELVKETLIPAFFVPMTGEAEKARQVQPDPSQPSIRGGDFESSGENGSVPGWYYSRNVEIRSDTTAPQGESVLVFDNFSVRREQRKKDALKRRELTQSRQEIGTPDEEESETPDLEYDPLTLRQREEELTAHALQGFPVDGRKVKKLDLSCQMEGVGLESLIGRKTVSTAALVFFDENREAIGETLVFALRLGDTPWNEFTHNEIPVPKKAREGSLRIGILDGIGVLKIDDIILKKHGNK